MSSNVVQASSSKNVLPSPAPGGPVGRGGGGGGNGAAASAAAAEAKGAAAVTAVVILRLGKSPISGFQVKYVVTTKDKS